MSREATRSLINEPDDPPEPPPRPRRLLAQRIRRQTLGRYVGRDHLLGERLLVRKLIEARAPRDTGKTSPSCSISGLPGTGYVMHAIVLFGVKDRQRSNGPISPPTWPRRSQPT